MIRNASAALPSAWDRNGSPSASTASTTFGISGRTTCGFCGSFNFVMIIVAQKASVDVSSHHLVSLLEQRHNTKETYPIPLAGELIMRPEHLYDLLHKRPFEPFRMYLTDGRVFD